MPILNIAPLQRQTLFYHIRNNQNKELFINLTPLIPLSILGEGERDFREGHQPLSNFPAFGVSKRGEVHKNIGSLRGALAPLFSFHSLSPCQGERDKG
jgi:hypothetical protein